MSSQKSSVLEAWPFGQALATAAERQRIAIDIHNLSRSIDDVRVQSFAAALGEILRETPNIEHQELVERWNAHFNYQQTIALLNTPPVGGAQ